MSWTDLNLFEIWFFLSIQTDSKLIWINFLKNLHIICIEMIAIHLFLSTSEAFFVPNYQKKTEYLCLG